MAESLTLEQRLAEVHARDAHARRLAFVDESLAILGFEQKPITLYTLNALAASLNAFSIKGERPSLVDVSEFLWLHSPRFNPADSKAKARFFRQVKAKTFPVGWKARDWARSRSKLAARWLGPTTLARISATIREIRSRVECSNRDFPKGSGDGKPLQYAHVAYLLVMAKREFGISFDIAEHMPLSRFIQLLRAYIDHASGGKANLISEAESAVLADHLARQTAISSSPEAMAAAEAEIKANAARRMAELGLS